MNIGIALVLFLVWICFLAMVGPIVFRMNKMNVPFQS
jgi:hypothetical protein